VRWALLEARAAQCLFRKPAVVVACWELPFLQQGAARVQCGVAVVWWRAAGARFAVFRQGRVLNACARGVPRVAKGLLRAALRQPRRAQVWWQLQNGMSPKC